MKKVSQAKYKFLRFVLALIWKLPVCKSLCISQFWPGKGSHSGLPKESGGESSDQRRSYWTIPAVCQLFPGKTHKLHTSIWTLIWWNAITRYRSCICFIFFSGLSVVLRSESSGTEHRGAKASRNQLPEQDGQETDSRQTRRPSRVPAQYRQAENMPEHRRPAAEGRCWRCVMLYFELKSQQRCHSVEL